MKHAAPLVNAESPPPRPGLIGAGLGGRLAGAGAAIALLWLTVFWALN